MRPDLFALYGGLLLFNALAWLWARAAFHGHPTLLAVALLAYSLGLRHAVDADHIAAIDNVTRKLMHSGRRPLTVGLWFALGHSTVVVLGSLLIVVTLRAMTGSLQQFTDVGRLIGTSVSACFLMVIALMNLWTLRSLVHLLHRARAGKGVLSQGMELASATGLLARLLRPLVKVVTRGWHMYPLGILFGLGFDTATELGVLAISASQAARGLSVWSILVFPFLFTAGMSLIDALDSTLMVGAYGWAFLDPVRKLYYNITVTGVSIVFALAVAGVEALDLIAHRPRIASPGWNGLRALDENLGMVGYGVIAAFLATWLISVAVFRMRQCSVPAADRRAS